MYFITSLRFSDKFTAVHKLNLEYQRSHIFALVKIKDILRRAHIKNSHKTWRERTIECQEKTQENEEHFLSYTYKHKNNNTNPTFSHLPTIGLHDSSSAY